MENFNVIITEQARNDIRDIHFHIAVKLADPYAAVKLANKIIDSANSLSSSPKRYRVCRKDSRGQEFRYMPVDSFMIIYTVNDERHVVNVFNIVYGKRNFDNII